MLRLGFSGWAHIRVALRAQGDVSRVEKTSKYVPPASLWFRVAAAFVWLATGSLVVVPAYRAIGRQYLELAGLPEWMMYVACAAEIILAIAVVSLPAVTWITWLQITAIAAFTLILGVADPMLLVNPFGMLTKNIPLVTTIVVAWRLQSVGWTVANQWFLRIGMAVIWVTEGLFPKILFQQQVELAVVRDSGLVPIDPSVFLVLMGLAQIVSGVLVLVVRGRLLSLLLVIQIVSLVILPLLVAKSFSLLWFHPFGPLTKNLPIIVGTFVVFLRHTPVLSANWSNVLLFSFRVPRDKLQALCPSGVELDIRTDSAWISFVSLDFSKTRIFHLPAIGFRSFPDINLRTYARSDQLGGVVFIRELVPSKVVAWVARVLFREPFQPAEIHSRVSREASGLLVERQIVTNRREQCIEARASLDLTRPEGTGDSAFLIERYWGFGGRQFGKTTRFRVSHEPWKVYCVESHRLDVDWESIYGSQWAFLGTLQPASVVLAEGSEVDVWFGV